MLEYLSTEVIVIFLAFGVLFGLLVVAGAIGRKRQRDRNFAPEPVRFVPHWQLMSMLILAAVVILAAIFIPVIMRFLSP